LRFPPLSVLRSMFPGASDDNVLLGKTNHRIHSLLLCSSDVVWSVRICCCYVLLNGCLNAVQLLSLSLVSVPVWINLPIHWYLSLFPRFLFQLPSLIWLETNQALSYFHSIVYQSKSQPGANSES
jgi:hypothetical protein